MILKNRNGKEVSKSKTGIREGKPMKYTNEQLSMALDLIEEGASHSEVEEMTKINKSILAREMRKRKNSKAGDKLREKRQLETNSELRSF